MDILTKKLFETERWEYAIEKGLRKGIDKSILRSLTDPSVRVALYRRVASGQYEIAPPHQALIPKDTPGEFRTVYVNEGVDRVFLSITNDLLFEMFPEMVHPSCKSYQKGTGCGMVVQRVSKMIADAKGKTIGWKADMKSYFDTVPIEYIDGVFDEIEHKIGEKSMVIDVLRKYYHADLCFDVDGNLIEQYQSLKQGCAASSFLADVVLYKIDEKLSKLQGYYVRYSDDTLFVGRDYKKAMQIMEIDLATMQMMLNPKKVEYLSSEHWFKFLGFAIKGNKISISRGRLKKFQKEIESRTTKCDTTFTKALNAVNRYLYKGNGEYAWAQQILGVVNVMDDIQKMNTFVVDSLRACQTGNKRIGGLGYVQGPDSVVARGKGRHVRKNRKEVDEVDGYRSLMFMRNALVTDKAAYRTLVMQM